MRISSFRHQRVIVLLALVVTAAPVNAAAYGEHRPVCSSDGASLVYMVQSERTDDDWELYRLDMHDRRQSRLTHHEGWDGYAVWSPDDRHIVFDRADGPGGAKSPWLMNLETLDIRQLGTYEGWLSVSDWGKDDELLAFHEKDGQRDLVLLNPDGEVTRYLTRTPEQSEHDAHFSPDGRRVAFANGPVAGGETSLEIIELDSGARTTLKTSAGRIYGLSWAPEGDMLAFVDAPGGEDDDADIFLFRLEDQSVQRVTDDPGWDHMPEFCGNRHILMFTSYRTGEERMYRIDPEPRPWLIVD